MALILSGTDGVSDVDGSAATPAVRGSDTNTGIFFPAADTIAFAEGGAEVARITNTAAWSFGSSGTATGTNGQVLTSAGSGAAPTWASPPAAGSMIFISSVTASNSATINFTGIGSTYDVYAIQIVKALPATDGAALRMRTSTNNGSSYDAGASDYDYVQSIGVLSGGTYAFANTGATDSFMRISFSIGNAANELGFNGWVYLWKPSDATYFSASYSGNGVDGDSQIYVVDQGMGRRLTAADVDAVRFLMSSGNITSGTFRLYGIKNS
jgi:hypothetical protein